MHFSSTPPAKLPFGPVLTLSTFSRVLAEVSTQGTDHCCALTWHSLRGTLRLSFRSHLLPTSRNGMLSSFFTRNICSLWELMSQMVKKLPTRPISSLSNGAVTHKRCQHNTPDTSLHLWGLSTLLSHTQAHFTAVICQLQASCFPHLLPLCSQGLCFPTPIEVKGQHKNR